MRFSSVLCLLTILLLSSSVVYTASPNFSDFDGDGFNDNLIDTDNNGIPDNYQSKVKEVSSSGNFTFSPGSFGKSENTTSTLSLSKSQQFSLYKFKCRLITNSRSDFEAGFSTGVNVNSSSGSSCVGGVCF